MGRRLQQHVSLPFSDAEEAACAKNPIPDLAASAFKVQRTGYYSGQNGSRTFPSRFLAIRLGTDAFAGATTATRFAQPSPRNEVSGC